MGSEPPSEVPALLEEGARLYNEGAFWEAHEAWEQAWLALKRTDLTEAACFVQGLILVTAAFENLRRGKPAGFATQGAKALHRMREHAGWGTTLGLADEEGFREAFTDVYLEAMRTKAADLDELSSSAPALQVAT